ncbi:MAG: hypothetical protein COB39_13475 [Marinosulfonomonas sp.]|nr:MAG: hypothetical protein COB39_13475 [Marinosulfonomonas sp.]
MFDLLNISGGVNVACAIWNNAVLSCLLFPERKLGHLKKNIHMNGLYKEGEWANETRGVACLPLCAFIGARG